MQVQLVTNCCISGRAEGDGSSEEGDNNEEFEAGKMFKVVNIKAMVYLK